MRYWLAILALWSGLAFAGVAPGPVFGSGGAITASSGGRTLVFNYPSGFTGAHSAFTLANGESAFADPVIDLATCSGSTGHQAGNAYYATKLNITSFTTEFTFQVNGSYGATFVIENDTRGTGASADANGEGYFQYTVNPGGTSIANSIGVSFNATPNFDGVGSTVSLTGLYIDGGNFIDAGINPVQDLNPQGINVGSNDVIDAVLTYDGTVLSMVLTDQTTSAKAYFAWTVNIPSIVGASTAYVGMGAGCVSIPGGGTLNSWTWYQGINTELSAPTFSPSPGSYTTSQTVSISGPSGSTIYYTTNGKPPTTASSVYSTPLTVSANEAIQAIAVESNYTNSQVATGNYQVQTSGSPTINFPSGFSGASSLIRTTQQGGISGSTLEVTSGAVQQQTGSAFYVQPVSISSFTANFTLAFSGTAGTHNGMMFVIENPAETGFNQTSVTFTGSLSAGATSATMSSTTSDGGVPWSSGVSPITLTLKFDDGETRAATFTSGSSTVTFAALTNSVGATAYFIQAPNTVVSGGPYSFGLGGTTDSYGYEGIGNSVGVLFDVWNGKVGIATDGGAPTTTAVTGISMGVNPLAVTLTYNGTTLSLTLKDTVTNATFGPVNWTENIPTLVGATTAYVGFTGGSYDTTSPNDVTAWTE